MLRADEEGGLARMLYFARHPALARIGLAAQQHPTCHLDIPYWSTTPYLFGPGRAVKYIVKPCSDRTSPMPRRAAPTPISATRCARISPRRRPASTSWCSSRSTAVRMPIEDATVEWDEEDSPYVAVARIRIPRQQRRRSRAAATPASGWRSTPGTAWRPSSAGQPESRPPRHLPRAQPVPGAGRLTAGTTSPLRGAGRP